MIDIFAKWGLDFLGRVALQGDDAKTKLLLEGYKTKTNLVSKRFDYAWDASQSLIQLAIDVEIELPDFNGSSSEEFLDVLIKKFHPRFYRKFTKVRSSFEATNDILSSYSCEISYILNGRNLQRLIKKAKIPAENNYVNDVKRFYRKVWTRCAEVMASLIRVTSNNLSFWLTEVPIGKVSDNWAKEDRLKIQAELLAEEETRQIREGQKKKDKAEHSHGIIYLKIEEDFGVKKFWDDVESYHKETDCGKC